MLHMGIWVFFPFFSPGKNISTKWVSNNGSFMFYHMVINGSLHPQRGTGQWHCCHSTSSGARSSVPALAAVGWTRAVSLTPVGSLRTSPGLEPVMVMSRRAEVPSCSNRRVKSSDCTQGKQALGGMKGKDDSSPKSSHVKGCFNNSR